MILEGIQREREINRAQLTTKNGRTTGIVSLVQQKLKERPMASEQEVKFYMERKRQLSQMNDDMKERDQYMILLDSNKNGAD
jgi:hypothetical protein